MPYASQRDRTVRPLEMQGAPWPAAPLNVVLTSGYRPGVWDVRWDNPAYLAHNSMFSIYGVNVYRSFDSEFGPYELVTDLSIGSTFWRDQTDIALEVDEDVSDRFLVRGAPSSGPRSTRFVFQVLHPPIVKASSQAVNADSPWDVQVFVDNQPALVRSVFGRTGEVEIDPTRYPEVGTQSLDPAVIPRPGSKVTCTYRHVRSLVRTDLIQRVFYRVTTVAAPVNPECPDRVGSLVETPLEYATMVSSMEIEKIDWIWREAVRRNTWILDQGGERVKVFLRKSVGVTCPCIPAADVHRQPISDCPNCYGTGIVGGFEGPYDMIIAPDDAERKIAQREMGRTVEHTYEVFAGPSPLLSHRDFLVKANGERYSIGPVRMPTNRGMVLQQHFNIGHMDEKDIRHSVPMDNPNRISVAQVHRVGPEAPVPSGLTDKPGIPQERQERGRTGTWENNTY
jgi:hypothetical protein